MGEGKLFSAPKRVTFPHTLRRNHICPASAVRTAFFLDESGKTAYNEVNPPAGGKRILGREA